MVQRQQMYGRTFEQIKINAYDGTKALCNYYGNGRVPIGAIRPLTDETFFDNYTYM